MGRNLLPMTVTHQVAMIKCKSSLKIAVAPCHMYGRACAFFLCVNDLKRRSELQGKGAKMAGILFDMHLEEVLIEQPKTSCRKRKRFLKHSLSFHHKCIKPLLRVKTPSSR